MKRSNLYSSKVPNYHSESQWLIQKERIDILSKEKQSVIQSRIKRNFLRDMELSAATEGKKINYVMFAKEDLVSHDFLEEGTAPQKLDRDSTLWQIIRTMDATELNRYTFHTVFDQLLNGTKKEKPLVC